MGSSSFKVGDVYYHRYEGFMIICNVSGNWVFSNLCNTNEPIKFLIDSYYAYALKPVKGNIDLFKVVYS